MKNADFFNKESSAYSIKRYVEKPISYTQFFFAKRLSVTLKMIGNFVGGKKELSLLDIGCADGIVVNEIYVKFPNTFASLVGIDTAPEMINTASKKYSSRPFVFQTRENFSDISKKNVIIETGVVNYADLSEELEYANSRLEKDGIYIVSLAGTDSLLNRAKKEDNGYRNFLSYAKYEKEIKNKFEIIRAVPVGLFLPFVWKLPTLARLLQPLEIIFRPISPNLFHEKVYLLRKK